MAIDGMEAVRVRLSSQMLEECVPMRARVSS